MIMDFNIFDYIDGSEIAYEDKDIEKIEFRQ